MIRKVFSKKGNNGKLDELFRENYEYIFKVVWAITLNREIAKDITQEAFLKAFLKIDTLRDKNKFDKWIYSIAINTCKDILRKENRLKTSNFDDLNIKDPTFLPEEVYELNETKHEIIKCIKEMDYATQQIINLKYYLGFSYEQISNFLNMSLSNVKVKVHRAKKKILFKLEPMKKKEAL